MSLIDAWAFIRARRFRFFDVLACYMIIIASATYVHLLFVYPFYLFRFFYKHCFRLDVV